MEQKGVAVIVILIALATIFLTALAILQGNNLKLNPTPTPKASPTPTPTLIPTPTPTPTATPTLKPTPIPTVTSKPIQTTNAPPQSGYGRITVSTQLGNFTADVVTLNIGAKMVTDTASEGTCDNDCPTLPLSDFVSRNGGFAGINGTYFCPHTYDECQSKKDAFDFPVFNTNLNRWINEDKLFWNDRSIVYQDGGGIHMLPNANSFSGSLVAGIVNYPGLIYEGNIIVNQDPLSDKLKGKGTKGGIGFNQSKIYLVIAYNVTSLEFAHLFKAIGANYAMNLDGGGSAALWYGGFRVGPGRNLPNAVIFK